MQAGWENTSPENGLRERSLSLTLAQPYTKLLAIPIHIPNYNFVYL